ncbi:MAG: acetyl-CoA carboxylase biotin carboxyl carrier protein subunit, partial [Calditrichaeota bacterium]|nr:acetyl-CoA carboxylase biotin carboxyl carrier protein subunit [Calditrichota bacterium]
WVIDERRERARALAGGDAVRSQSGELHAPMPGLVVKMLASTGDRVDKGAGLVVVEAMKMENEFRSPVAGIVREVRVQPGQTVEKGELLVSIEKDGQV